MQENENMVDANIVSDEVPGWKRLDSVIRTWVIQRQFEEDLQNYQIFNYDFNNKFLIFILLLKYNYKNTCVSSFNEQEHEDHLLKT